MIEISFITVLKDFLLDWLQEQKQKVRHYVMKPWVRWETILSFHFWLTYTLQHPWNTSGHSKTPSDTTNTSPSPPRTALTFTKHSSDSLRGIWVVKRCLEGLCEKWGCQKMSVECQEYLWVSRLCQGCHGSVWRYLRVSGGCLEGLERCFRAEL